MRRILAPVAVLALLVVLVPSPAYAAPPPPPTPAVTPPPPPAESVAGRKFHRGADPVTVDGASFGGAVNSTTAWGLAYQSGSATSPDFIVLQTTDVDVLYCSYTWGGTFCWPYTDLGTIAHNEIYGPGSFWTPPSGSATKTGLTPGNSYMIQSTHKTYTASGQLIQGTSSSAIFTLPSQ